MTSSYTPESGHQPSANSLSIAQKFKHIPNFSKFWEQAQAQKREFDWQFYVEFYEDLQPISDPRTAYEHWILFGQIEGRVPNQQALEAYISLEYQDLPEDFDAEGYWVLNPELRADLTKNKYREFKAIEHFMQCGRHTFKRYKSDFDWKFYIEFNDDLVGLTDYETAYDHWVLTGQEEGRLSSKAEMTEWLEQRKSELPENFNHQTYLGLNLDLQLRFDNSKHQMEQAIYHFLQYGITEERPYYFEPTYLSPSVLSKALNLYAALSDSSQYLPQAADTENVECNALIHFAQTEAGYNQDRIDRLRADSSLVAEALAFYQAALQIQTASPEVISRLSKCFDNQNASLWKTVCGRYECYDKNYSLWLNENMPDSGKLGGLAEKIETFSYRPTISIIFPVYNTPILFLREAIDSVISQIYPNWELCIADDKSTKPHVRSILEEYAAQDSRIKICFREENGHISACSNSAIELASGEFVALLDHDDVVTPDALYEVVELLNRHPEADMIYSDEDKLTENGHLTSPYFKPDWCPDAFLSRMYTCHLGIYRRCLVQQIGGFRLGYEGSQDYDLVLRLTEITEQIFHIPKILYHWRMHVESTAGSASAKPYAYTAAIKALQAALWRRGEPGEVTPHPIFPGLHAIRYQITRPGLISIIIPTRNLSSVLEKCLNSIFTKSTYLNYEVIVIDNGSDEPELKDLLLKWQNYYPERFRFYLLDVPFNFSLINNYAVERARGEYLLFLNNDIEVITPDWLESLLEQAQRPSIGAVGSLLVYPDNSVQHAGVILGIQGVANHGHRYVSSELPGYFGHIATPNNYLAVTGACLLCRREVFLEVGGFNEALAVSYNDVDLCLKMIEKGYRNIYIPHAKLYHHESKSRGYEDSPSKQQRLQRESQILYQRWEEYIENDPCYSANLTRESIDYSFRFAHSSAIQIVSVSYFESELRRFRDFAMDDIEPGNIYRNFLPIRGWVLRDESLVVGIEIVMGRQIGEHIVQFIPINEIRADVASHRSELLGAGCSGFKTELNFIDWASTAELAIQAVLANGARILFCQLHLKTVDLSNAVV